jgi:hypothetical protein
LSPAYAVLKGGATVNMFSERNTGRREQKGTYDAIFPALPLTNCRSTLCPFLDIVSEAENILKTKNRESAFFKNEAGNLLKRNPLTKNRRNSQIA